MSTTLILALLSADPALAGYGDAYEVEVELWDGSTELQWFPSYEERAMHLWTNAVRVDPERWEADYNAGGCGLDDFSDDERTAKPPLFIDTGLNEASRWHCEDMKDNSHFAHESSSAAGGMSFAARVAMWYESGAVGENIAQGYSSEYSAVMNGWMCSTSGHRANIMSASWNELGTGVDANYYTQDFGSGTLDTDSPVAMAVHDPKLPDGEVTFLADWYRDSAPDRFRVIVDGQGNAMEHLWGDPDMGVYGVTLPVEDDACHQYYFVWGVGQESGTWPEEGSYTYGTRCDQPGGWVAVQQGFDEDLFDDDEDPRIVGCSAAPAGPAGLALIWLAGALAAGRRRA